MDKIACFHYHQWMDVLIIRCTLNRTPIDFKATNIFQGPTSNFYLEDFIYDLNITGYVKMDYENESFIYYHGKTKEEVECSK